MGATLANQERLAEAVEHFERALALDAADDQVRSDLARAAYELRRFDRALLLFRELVDHGHASLENLECMARVHLSWANPPALFARPGSPPAVSRILGVANLLSTVHYHDRDIARLETTLHEQLALDPSNVLTLEKLAVYYRECSRHGEAKACIDRAIRLDPASPRLRYQSGMIYFGLGQVADAEVEFLRALGLESDHLDTWHGLGLLYLSSARPQEARGAFAGVAVAPRDYRGPWTWDWWLARDGDERASRSTGSVGRWTSGMDDDAALETVVIAARDSRNGPGPEPTGCWRGVPAG